MYLRFCQCKIHFPHPFLLSFTGILMSPTEFFHQKTSTKMLCIHHVNGLRSPSGIWSFVEFYGVSVNK